jgi:DNA polymerase I-like protein with 3'-5' exonuclease and polymerase domains
VPSLKSQWNPFLKAERPNIRSMFQPDPGHILIECDLKQSDAQVVAFEANDTELMEIFTRMNSGEDIDVHLENAKVCFGTHKIVKWQRQLAKHVVHGTNFGGSSYEIARRLGMLKHQVDVFQLRWFAAHPRIREWHRAIDDELARTRSVRNIFGYRRLYFDRMNDILPEALAWKPQSTTALVINAGIRNVRRVLPQAQLLMQVHDSGVWQVPAVLFTDAFKLQMKSCLSIQLPYPRPLTIGVDMKISSTNWGDAEKVQWNNTETTVDRQDFQVLANELSVRGVAYLPLSVQT